MVTIERKRYLCLTPNANNVIEVEIRVLPYDVIGPKALQATHLKLRAALHEKQQDTLRRAIRMVSDPKQMTSYLSRLRSLDVSDKSRSCCTQVQVFLRKRPNGRCAEPFHLTRLKLPPCLSIKSQDQRWYRAQPLAS